ncbi:hypothetical protein PIB30_071107 [Stylosanthes scabra]|uniref:Uncharacterized protein n=1 Tax=Stylosanthes scabra TaxID=79078 RepID=A0ABU6SNS5_9FABA|nr:hypothetical protein [Stylosanthes scabra]
MVTDNTTAVTAGSTADNGVRTADTAAAMMAEGTTATRVGNSEMPDTAELGQGEAAEADLACKLHHRRCKTLYIHMRCDPSSAHRTKTPRTYHACPCPLILGPSPLKNVFLSTVLGLLVNIVSARLHIRPPACGRAFTLPPDIQALHPCPSSASGASRGKAIRSIA